jgi:hypothetical protein
VYYENQEKESSCCNSQNNMKINRNQKRTAIMCHNNIYQKSIECLPNRVLDTVRKKLQRGERERGREARATQIEWNATAAVTVVGSGGGDGGDGGNKESNSERAMF